MTAPTQNANAQAVREAWGEVPPEWVVALAEVCDRASQAKVASSLGVSSSMVNQALRNRYRGDLGRLADRVRGEYLRQTVGCPVLGEVSSRRCLDEQARPFAATNAMRVDLWRACHGGCEHFRGGHGK